MSSEVWNLIAAILCTISATIFTVAALLSAPTYVNVLAAIGAAVGALGGVAWVVSAALLLRWRNGRQ